MLRLLWVFIAFAAVGTLATTHGGLKLLEDHDEGFLLQQRLRKQLDDINMEEAAGYLAQQLQARASEGQEVSILEQVFQKKDSSSHPVVY